VRRRVLVQWLLLSCLFQGVITPLYCRKGGIFFKKSHNIYNNFSKLYISVILHVYVCSVTDIQKYIRFISFLTGKKEGAFRKTGANAFFSSTQCEEKFGQKKLKVK
jgi:hypothetical protein